MNWSAENYWVLLPLGLGWLAVWWLLPREKPRSRILGGLLGVAALLALQATLLPPAGDVVRDVMFYVFSGAAILCAGLMITDRNPVYAALWFALTTLAVCGLFLLNSAPFLAAATIIVYAGANIVTVLFVIMLAQQAGSANYDRQSFQPTGASVLAFVLLATLLFSLQEWGALGKRTTADAARGQFVAVPEGVRANLLSQPPSSNPREIGSLRVLGRSLFTDYLYAVELAGTVLLVATIGAIALAPRRAQGHL
jgi:NADH-quinone oxidoreductase subunit J